MIYTCHMRDDYIDHICRKGLRALFLGRQNSMALGAWMYGALWMGSGLMLNATVARCVEDISVSLEVYIQVLYTNIKLKSLHTALTPDSSHPIFSLFNHPSGFLPSISNTQQNNCALRASACVDTIPATLYAVQKFKQAIKTLSL